MAVVMSWSLASFFQEGPHSALNEDEFFDALEMAYQEDELESVRYCVCYSVLIIYITRVKLYKRTAQLKIQILRNM